MTSPKFTLIAPRWIVPVLPRQTVLEDHALVLQEELIVALAPVAEAQAQYPHATRIELPNHLLTPGFVNAHGHAAMTLLRGFADDLPLMRWLNDHIWPAEASHVDESFVYDGTLLAAAEMLLGGTTCAIDTYFFPDAVARAFTDAGIRGQVCLPVIQFGNAWAADEAEHIHKGLELHDALRHNPLLQTAFAPHSPYTVTDAGLRRVVVLAQELDIPIHLHLHETADEVATGLATNGVRPFQHMASLGLLGPSLQIVHATQLLDSEIESIALHGVHVAHCPSSNMKLGSGRCRVADLLGAGVNVALGTDGAASNNNLDMIREMSNAALLAKLTGTTTDLPAWQALEAATLNGARLLGLSDTIGSLEPGKRADLAAIDMGGLAQQPVYDQVSQLVYTCTDRNVSHTWVNGELLVADGSLTHIDQRQLIETTRGWQRRIAGGTGYAAASTQTIAEGTSS